MLQIGWNGIILYSLHTHEVVSEMWPHSLEISVFSSRHFFFGVDALWWWSCIHILVYLHVEREQSRLGFVLDETLYIFKLLVLPVWTANGANLERVSCFGLCYNILTSEVFIMDIFLILAALMVTSKDILFTSDIAALQ